MTTISGIAFALAFLALALRWITPLARYWYLAVIASLLVASASGLISIPGLIAPLILLALVYFKLQGIFQHNTSLRTAIDVTVIVLCLLLAVHQLPGFNNISVIDQAVIKNNSAPYSLWFNYDKALVSVFLISGFISVTPEPQALRSAARWTAIGLTINLLLLFLPSLALGWIALDVEVPDFIGIWLVSNLLITSMLEEAFFRGVIQQRLEDFLQAKGLAYASAVAVFTAALLFGLAHSRSGLFFVVTGSLAGLVYGLVFAKTRRIETAVLTHFFTNSIHILCFSYPVLAAP